METEARISIVDGALADLESLYDWLTQEHALMGGVKLEGPAPRENELGAVANVLAIAVGAGGAIPVLASALKAWILLPRRSDVCIRVEGPEGRVVQIDAKRINETRIDDLLRQAFGYGNSEG
jgi:Effector Associated Constant Component 1